MTQNPNNRGTSYEETFDVERIAYIAKLVREKKGTTGLSDLECHVHSILKSLLKGG